MMARPSVGIRCAVIVALGLITLVPPARAEPVDMAPQHYSKATRDGWNLNISIEGERINSIPNLAAAANSREAFVTLSATATATAGTPDTFRDVTI
jgi:MspA